MEGVAVVGSMHHGTSAVARVLLELGVDMGGPFFDGKWGYPCYESRELRKILLHQCACRCKNRNIINYLRRRESDQPWGFKAPALGTACLCPPQLWVPWLRGLRIVSVERPWSDVYRSIHSRWKDKTGERLEVVRRSVLGNAVLLSEAPPPLVRVSYPELMEKPRPVVERLAVELGLSPDNIDRAVEAVHARKD